MSIHKGLV